MHPKLRIKGALSSNTRAWQVVVVVLASALVAGCALYGSGPNALDQSRLKYNEVVKATTE